MSFLLISIILVLISSIFAGFGGFIFKISSKNISFKISNLLRNYKLIGGFLLSGIAVIIYIISLRFGELNIIYPISSITYVWSTLLAKKYLNEKINLSKATGIALIILGAALVVN